MSRQPGRQAVRTGRQAAGRSCRPKTSGKAGMGADGLAGASAKHMSANHLLCKGPSINCQPAAGQHHVLRIVNEDRQPWFVNHKAEVATQDNLRLEIPKSSKIHFAGHTLKTRCQLLEREICSIRRKQRSQCQCQGDSDRNR